MSMHACILITCTCANMYAFTHAVIDTHTHTCTLINITIDTYTHSTLSYTYAYMETPIFRTTIAYQ